MESTKRLGVDFFSRDVLEVAPALIGKMLVRKFSDGSIKKYIITETEAYRGEDDLACHASKGRTKRTEIMYHEGGHIYVYLIYGMHYMLNFVTASINNPQAVLIRGVNDVFGPGRVTKLLNIDMEFHKQSVLVSNEIWVEDSNLSAVVKTGVRVGIDYAGDYWKNKKWRYLLDS